MRILTSCQNSPLVSLRSPQFRFIQIQDGSSDASFVTARSSLLDSCRCPRWFGREPVTCDKLLPADGCFRITLALLKSWRVLGFTSTSIELRTSLLPIARANTPPPSINSRHAGLAAGSVDDVLYAVFILNIDENGKSWLCSQGQGSLCGVMGRARRVSGTVAVASKLHVQFISEHEMNIR